MKISRYTIEDIVVRTLTDCGEYVDYQCIETLSKRIADQVNFLAEQ